MLPLFILNNLDFFINLGSKLFKSVVVIIVCIFLLIYFNKLFFFLSSNSLNISSNNNIGVDSLYFLNISISANFKAKTAILC